ncbi:MAG: hypothetical protein WCQ99_12845 [Pseudomonadota bacterium]
MNREQLTARNPLRLLDKIISGGLGSGNLGVTMARAGVGKTAFLVQMGLDALIREKNVLHVALDQTTEHVHAWYDALFKAFAGSGAAGSVDTDAIDAALFSMTQHRVIQTYAADMEFTPLRLEQTVSLFLNHINFKPNVILIDGFDWEALSPVRTAAAVGAFKACAQRLGAELWMSAQTHRTVIQPGSIMPPCDAYAELIDVGVFLEPEGDQVSIRVLKDHANENISASHLLIQCDTFSLTTERSEKGLNLPSTGYTLLSGGAQGAEAVFGECAEKWALQEINFSFEGHQTARTRGLVNLTCNELAQGHVSDVYINAKMHRTYPNTPLFRKVLQSIWHQVNTAGEVFVVGEIQPDATVRGGTGWAAELSKHWKKPVHVFDQIKNLWYTWNSGTWAEESDPVITRIRFAGTGTRFINDQGRAAVQSLFERSFGPAKNK